MFSFEQLRGFVAVAEELHYGRAAERLCMTQPPLSRLIQKLEREVGAHLLDRDSRGVRLTAAGTAFLPEARRLLALAHSAPELARRISSGEVGALKVGFTAGAGYGPLPQLLAELAQRLPAVEVQLFEMVTREQCEALQTHEIDLGLARPPFDRSLLEHRVLLREELVVMVPEGHGLNQVNRVLEVDDLLDQPLIMFSPEKARYFHDLVVALLPARPQAVAHSVSQILTMAWLVQAGRGVAVVPVSAAKLGVSGLQFLPLRTRIAQPVELHLVWSRDSSNPAVPTALAAIPGGNRTMLKGAWTGIASGE